ncbi:hypothetical protein WA026_015141 [Henosepilachna vigintioctopunctata]|uniref:HTH CENPB-type domain-containing protein n=1 Tax=Henosepilachna vigintioctopunctata TaxID=420089 RepID=A0AAW1TUW9_9CUCU
MESRMYGLTTHDVLTLAYQLAERNNLSHPVSEAKGKAGHEWLRGFRRRHPDITMPETTEMDVDNDAIELPTSILVTSSPPLAKNTSNIEKTSESSEGLPPALAVGLPSTSFGVVTFREV